MERLQSKTGFLTVFVGETGSGKSCLSQDLLEDAPKWCVLDVQDEIEDENIPSLHEMTAPADKFKISPAYNEVSDLVRVMQHTKGYTFLLEESTGFIDNDFFKSNLGKEMIKCVLSKRHTQKKVGGGNNYIFCFHSVKTIPDKLWTYIDFFYMFPSAERNMDTERGLMEIQEKIKNAPDVKFKDWYISPYGILVRTRHGQKNIHYIAKHKDNIHELSKRI